MFLLRQQFQAFPEKWLTTYTVRSSSSFGLSPSGFFLLILVPSKSNSTTAELFSALAINFPSVVNFFILLNDTRSDISTSNENISLKKIQKHFQLCILYIICSIYGLEIDIALKTGIIH